MTVTHRFSAYAMRLLPLNGGGWDGVHTALKVLFDHPISGALIPPLLPSPQGDWRLAGGCGGTK